MKVYIHVHTHTHTHTKPLNCLQMHKHSQAVFSVSAYPLTPSGPPPLTFTPQACIPSIADTGATGHVTYWIKPQSGPHAEHSYRLSASTTCIVCKQTLTLTFSVHPYHLSVPTSNRTKEASIEVLFFSIYDDLRSTKYGFWSLLVLLYSSA